MVIESDADLTDAVVRCMQQCDNPRLRDIMVSLVEHLHGFVRDVGLTEDEFREATKIVNEIGQLSTPSHNEAVLLAGSLGVSSLVCLLNNTRADMPETTHNLLGPFWRSGAPHTDNGATIVRSETRGLSLRVDLHLVGEDGEPVRNAIVDVWHAAPNGRYENEDQSQVEMNLRGRFASDEEGRVTFTTVRPSGYPIPTHGVVGRMLASQHRHPNRPAHLHVLAFREGYKTLITQVYDSTDQNLDTDPQFGVTRATIGEYVEQPSGADEAYVLNIELIMVKGRAEWPAAPID